MAAIGPVAPIRNAQPPSPRKVRKLRVAATRAERSIMHFGLIPQVCRAQLEWLTSEIEAVRLVGLGLAVSGLSGRLEAPRT